MKPLSKLSGIMLAMAAMALPMACSTDRPEIPVHEPQSFNANALVLENQAQAATVANPHVEMSQSYISRQGAAWIAAPSSTHDSTGNLALTLYLGPLTIQEYIDQLDPATAFLIRLEMQRHGLDPFANSFSPADIETIIDILSNMRGNSAQAAAAGNGSSKPASNMRGN